MMRIGHGYDIHAFNHDAPEAPLFLGGILIDAPYSLKAHSDGDVIIHAICDALLGAAGMGDIGSFFPDTDPAHTNQSSHDFLTAICTKLADNQYHINNIDVSVVTEKPKLNPFIASMREQLAKLTNITTGQINIKATTSEKLGFIGRKEGMAAYSVALIQHQANQA